jgi:DNA-binding MarR family transcriptional regulator
MTQPLEPTQHAVLMDIATNCRCNNLRQAARSATAFYNSYLVESGLTAAQCPLLVNLILAGPQQIQVLATRMAVDRTTLSRNLRVLAAQDYVQIAPGQDQRTRVVEITANGRAVLLQAVPRWQAAQHAFLTAIGAETGAALFDACAIAAAIDAHD